MILKINAKNNSFSEMFDFLESLGDFIICNKNIYVETKFDKKVKKYFKSGNVNVITEDNYKEEKSDMVVTWLKEKLIKQELDDFEKTEECQATLRKFSEYMDILESNRFGGVNSGERNEKAGTDPSC